MPRGSPGKFYDPNARRRERYSTDEEYRKRLLAIQKKAYKKNRKKRLETRKKYYENNVVVFWERRIAHLYGLSKLQYAEMLKQQGGRCKICKGKQVNGRKRFDVDHDHKTGKVRGLLCGHCNRAIGLLKDDPMLALCLAQYLGAEVILALKAVAHSEA